MKWETMSECPTKTTKPGTWYQAWSWPVHPQAPSWFTQLGAHWPFIFSYSLCLIHIFRLEPLIVRTEHRFSGSPKMGLPSPQEPSSKWPWIPRSAEGNAQEKKQKPRAIDSSRLARTFRKRARGSDEARSHTFLYCDLRAPNEFHAEVIESADHHILYQQAHF